MDVNLKMKKHFLNVLLDEDFDILLMIGGYGSGKSFTGFLKTALLSSNEKRKILIVRKVYATLKDSCFEDLKDAFSVLEVENDWNIIKSPYEAANKLNGSKIIFKGMDDYRKLKSIKNVDYILVEEADELTVEDLKELRKRLRVLGTRSHFILMCNPVSKLSSVYKMFFTEEGFNFSEEELYEKKELVKREAFKIESGEEKEMVIKVHHSTYKDNPFLPANFIYELENEKDPRIKRIAKDGKFGADGELVLYNAVFENNVYENYIQGKLTKRSLYRGIDWGFTTSYTCGLKLAVNKELNELYIYWEYYERKKSTPELFEGLNPLKDDNIEIFADREPRTIQDFEDAGFNITGAKKGPHSVEYHEQMLRSFSRIVIDIKRCPNVKKEAEECVYKKASNGDTQPGKYNIDPHSFDAASYGLTEYDYQPLKKRAKKFYSRR